jgi:hypothetical protein
VGRLLVKASVLTASVALAAAACSKSSAPAVPPSSAIPPATIPTGTTITQPVTYGYYDGHVDDMLSTDVSNKAQAAARHINYSAALTTQPPGKFPALYMITGPAAPDQPMVFGSEPGETDYSPLWQEITVTWKAGVKPVLLVKDDQIKELAAKGELTIAPTRVVLDCPIVRVTSSSSVPTATTITQPVTYGYYDGHVDDMLSTDVSNKAQAAARHINYSAALTTQPPGKFPALYMITGPAAPDQPMVFGSEPGETDYSPLWQEITVTWKAGVKPVLLIKDDQIKELAAKGELTVAPTRVVLDCPIVKVT